jgi:hypothetical protein
MKSARQELLPAAHQLTIALDSVQLRGMYPVASRRCERGSDDHAYAALRNGLRPG